MTHTVFVYGSLKRGFRLNDVLSHSKFLMKTTTEHADFEMKSLVYFPGVISGDKMISGELYEVSDGILSYLDMVESNGEFYQRREVEIHNPKGKPIIAWMYILLQEPPDSVMGVHYDEEWNIQTWKGK